MRQRLLYVPSHLSWATTLPRKVSCQRLLPWCSLPQINTSTLNPLHRPQHPSFSTSVFTLKKKSRQVETAQDSTADDAPIRPSHSNSTDPLSITTLETKISETTEWLKEKLGELRAGGRFNPKLLEDLRVTIARELGKEKAESGKRGAKHDARATTERLGDLAQVVPKGGRALTVMVAEEDVSYLQTASRYRRWGQSHLRI